MAGGDHLPEALCGFIMAAATSSILVITQGQLGLKVSFRADGEKHEFEFESGHVSIGRRSDCDIIIQNSSISRLHATVDLENGRWILRDNGSEEAASLRTALLDLLRQREGR